jgi:hypothetical protein
MNREGAFKDLFDHLAESINSAKALDLGHVEYLLKLAIMEANQQAIDVPAPTTELAAARDQELSCNQQH